MFRKGYTFDDVCLVPCFNNVASRKDPDVSGWITKDIKIEIPIVNAPMDTVISEPLADILLERGTYPIFHRFNDPVALEGLVNKYTNKAVYSCGLNDIELVSKLVDKGANKFLIDIANGHCLAMLNTIETLKKRHSNISIMAGNVCTAMGYMDLVRAGADSVRVGVGGGCFTSETKVLKSDGTYENINRLKVGDLVLNGSGNPVRVKHVVNNGFKKVIKIRTSNWPVPVYVTKDHLFYIGDLTACKYDTIQTKGIAKTLDCREKIEGHMYDRKKWFPIGDLDMQKQFLLTPNDLRFQLPADFTIDLGNFLRKGHLCTETITTVGSRKGNSNIFNRFLHSDYNLGYVFGLFLGDGHAKLEINSANNTECGRVVWYLGKNETQIVEKLKHSLKALLGESASFTLTEKRNMLVVTCYNKLLAKLLYSFGKKEKKHLPNDYFCSNLEYLKGVFDGLFDSDGNLDSKRKTLHNTSSSINELFNFLCLSLGYTFSSTIRKPTAGGLKGTSAERCLPSYVTRLHSSRRKSRDYWYSTLLEVEEVGFQMETWDIEVDCPSHSFIANNSIVHNSACSTRIKTAVGVPQFTAIYDCAEMAKKFKVPVIADGGIKGSREVCLALAAGATAVMVGKLFALTEESAAEKSIDKDRNGNLYAKYRGQASADFQKDFYGKVKDNTVPEGVDFWAPVSGSAHQVVNDLVGGLRSSMTYLGAKNLKEYQAKAEFMEVTANSYMLESNPRKD